MNLRKILIKHMKNIGISEFIICLIIIVIIVSLGFFISNYGHNNIYVPSLAIMGDIEQPFSFKSLQDFDVRKINYKDNIFKGILLSDIIKKSIPFTDEYSVVLIGRDGLMAELLGKNFEECYISFSAENGWEAINLKHPLSSNIKHIKEIGIVANEIVMSKGLNLITPRENLASLNPGLFLLHPFINYPYHEGTSTYNNNSVSIYSWRKYLRLEDIKNISNGKKVKDIDGYRKVVVVGKKGKMTTIYGFDQDFIEIKQNHFDYVYGDKRNRIEYIRGIIFDPPIATNRDVFYDTLHYLKQDEKVLVVLLDGFGYHQYLYASENKFLPYINKNAKAKIAMTSYLPVTNTGLAAVLTGKSPDKNGVYSRKQKDLKVPDLFQKANELDKKTCYIEGNIKIINTSIEPLLNPDINKNGLTDDEVFNTTQDHINDGYDLIFTHFHGIDDAGHLYGDINKNVMEVINQTDNYISQLARLWPGKIIITADHGMHSTSEGGDHGQARFEDMFVPYLEVGSEKLEVGGKK